MVFDCQKLERERERERGGGKYLEIPTFSAFSLPLPKFEGILILQLQLISAICQTDWTGCLYFSACSDCNSLSNSMLQLLPISTCAAITQRQGRPWALFTVAVTLATSVDREAFFGGNKTKPNKTEWNNRWQKYLHALWGALGSGSGSGSVSVGGSGSNNIAFIMQHLWQETAWHLKSWPPVADREFQFESVT